MKTRASVALMWLLGFAGLGAENDFISVPPTFTGNWSWNFTMPDGTAVRPKVKLVQDGDKVTGTSSLRPGTEIAITNGAVQDKVVTFEVVRRQHGDTVTTRYHGTRDGNIIRGEVESNWTGEKRTYPWEARRLAGIEGTWKWKVQFGTRTFDAKVTLKLEGEKLTGSMPGRDGRPIPIKNGSFKEGEVAFDVERGRDDFRSIAKYDGKLEGDVIKGTIETTFGEGEPRTDDWEATRAD